MVNFGHFQSGELAAAGSKANSVRVQLLLLLLAHATVVAEFNLAAWPLAVAS